LPVEELTWSWPVAFALFFGGLGGGAFITAAVTSYLTQERWKDILKFGSYIGVISATLCILSFAADTPTPERAFFLYSNPGSMITFGSSVLTIIIPLGILYVTFLPPDSLPWLKSFFPWWSYRKARNIVELLVFIFGICLIGYTGIVLGVVASKPFWASPMMSALFFASGMSTAVMTIGLCISALYPYTLTESAKRMLVETLHRLNVANAYLVLIEMLAVFLYTVETAYGPPAAASAVMELIAGSLSFFFWGGFVTLGLLIPLVVAILSAWIGRTRAFIRFYPALMMVASVCVLAGGLTMRYLILTAGQLA
jgi:formate-dependent nitrite reductase membrane component NrfD